MKDYNLYISIISSSLSIIVSIIALRAVQFRARMTVLPKKFFSRFIVQILVFIVLTTAVIAGISWYRYFSKPSRPRIAMLIPIDISNTSPPYDDGRRQFSGFTKLIEKEPELLRNFDFVFYNHQMLLTEARNIVVKELRKGTEYFVCSMSQIAIGLSEEFDDLVKKHARSRTCPILISTVSSAMDIKTKKNSVYRFYIRSKEEAEILTLAAQNLLDSKAGTYIAVDDAYGRGAVDEFEEDWINLGYTFIPGIYVGKSWNKMRVEQKIKENFLNKINENVAIFIVHYGNGLDNIFHVLRKFEVYSDILVTSTAADDKFVKLYADYIDRIKIITCIPVNNDGSYAFSDVIKDFFYYTLHRLVKTITSIAENKVTFDEAWNKCDEPKGIVYEKDNKREGDYIIKVIAVPQGILAH